MKLENRNWLTFLKLQSGKIKATATHTTTHTRNLGTTLISDEGKNIDITIGVRLFDMMMTYAMQVPRELMIEQRRDVYSAVRPNVLRIKPCDDVCW